MKFFVYSSLAMVALACSPQLETMSELRADDEFITYSGEIRVSVAHAVDPAQNDYQIVLAGPMGAAEMGVCVANGKEECTKGVPGYFNAELIYHTSERKFFRTAQSAFLEEGLRLTIVAFDQAGEQVDTRTIRYEANGTLPPPPGAGDVDANADANQNPDPNDQGGQEISYAAKVDAVVQAKCATCHKPGGSYAQLPLTNFAEVNAKSDRVVARSVAGTMPPGGGLPDAEKALFKQWQDGGFKP
jgi:mono/diheme cytochrome c family protein